MADLDKKLVSLFDKISDSNLEWVKRKGTINTSIMAIDKDYKIEMYALMFTNNDEKRQMREQVKKRIINQDILGYIFISDAVMTQIDKKTKKGVHKEALVQILFTPKGKKHRFIIHDGKKIVEEMDEKELTQHHSEWDLWNDDEDKMDKETNALYEKYKKDHPEMQKLLGESHVLKNEDKIHLESLELAKRYTEVVRNRKDLLLKMVELCDEKGFNTFQTYCIFKAGVKVIEENQSEFIKMYEVVSSAEEMATKIAEERKKREDKKK